MTLLLHIVLFLLICILSGVLQLEQDVKVLKKLANYQREAK